MSLSAKAGITLNTPIDRIIMMIARRLQLDDGYDYKFERWIKLLKDNWIRMILALLLMRVLTMRKCSHAYSSPSFPTCGVESSNCAQT